ncbi:hypothetical protein E2C01_065379 [Portunus trituberculatus]|uniref:Uncharacterized protein n=1 Tax=Portunus trituberculatus TaxID=210409 RepID=A0A5B7HEE8_PORTR|nr:hypothetical protein [Portunus trituberculatus]
MARSGAAAPGSRHFWLHPPGGRSTRPTPIVLPLVHTAPLPFATPAKGSARAAHPPARCQSLVLVTAKARALLIASPATLEPPLTNTFATLMSIDSPAPFQLPADQRWAVAVSE